MPNKVWRKVTIYTSGWESSLGTLTKVGCPPKSPFLLVGLMYARVRVLPDEIIDFERHVINRHKRFRLSKNDRLRRHTSQKLTGLRDLAYSRKEFFRI